MKARDSTLPAALPLGPLEDIIPTASPFIDRPYRLCNVKEATSNASGTTCNTIVGATDGVNKTFTLSRSPLGPASLALFVNKDYFGDNHYTLTTNVIVFDVAPVRGAIIWAQYMAQFSS